MAKVSRRAVALYVARELSDANDRHHKKVVLQLAAFLVDTRRTKELPLIIRDIEYYLAEAGSVSGVITTAFDLTAETKKAIEKYVKEQTGAKTVELDNIIDPTVLGGVKVSIPGHELDATVRRNLTILKTQFKKI
ncbi:MAG: F0F1 ATP synthase subunit delta [Patescibacteria group bacterium]